MQHPRHCRRVFPQLADGDLDHIPTGSSQAVPSLTVGDELARSIMGAKAVYFKSKPVCRPGEVHSCDKASAEGHLVLGQRRGQVPHKQAAKHLSLCVALEPAE